MECFEGRYQDYQPIDAHYHDLEHTLQGACAWPGCSATATTPTPNPA